MSISPLAALVTPERLAALDRTGLLDSPAEEAFDRLTRLASYCARAPVALVSLVDDHRQFFKSCLGLPEPWASQRETPISHSFCQHVVATSDALVIEDARTDPRVAGNRAIDELGVVAYLGVPLRTSEGFVLGALCVIDSQPRKWTKAEISVLIDLAEAAGTEIGLRFEVDERRRTEHALREAKETAEAATRAKSEFLAKMSHEIRTPMNGIVGMTEIALETDLTAEQREYLGMVRSSADALLTIINDLLDFSKIEAGKLELDPADFDVEESLGDLLKPLSLRAADKGLDLAFQVGEDVPEAVIGDAGRLRQVLINLVGNAIKFTERGEVVVLVRRESARGDACRLRFTISDTGIGIPPDRQEAIFEAFAQAEASTTRRYGGTGLGLAISAQLVRLMGGELRVSSEVGKGSTFEFTLPFRSGRVSRVGQAPPADLRGRRVLVVDDNGTNRRILTETLRAWGMVTTAVANGRAARDALATVGSPEFDAMVLDVYLPDADGIELLEELRGCPALAELPVIVHSSAGRGGEAARCGQLGATYLLKPAKRSELLRAVCGLLAPTLEAEGTARGDRPPTGGTARGSLRILLAEDNLVNQRIAVKLLERLGHSARVVGDGTEAVAVSEKELFDLVLMDVQMPGMSGLEATQAIRRREQTTGRYLPIVAMTAYAMNEDRERCLSAGMDGYVTKPVRPAELERAIEALRRDAPRMDQGPPEPEVTAPAPPVLDRDALARAVDDDSELLADIIGLFRASCPEYVRGVQTAIEEGDAVGLQKQAHTLKGMLANLHAVQAAVVAQELESLGSAGELGPARDALRRLEEALPVVDDALDRVVV